MKTVFKTIDELIKNDEEAPLPMNAIPNHMGINLCSVEGMSWTEQDDGQLLNLTIHFIPAKKEECADERGSGFYDDSESLPNVHEVGNEN